jgi:hypothetical protein
LTPAEAKARVFLLNKNRDIDSIIKEATDNLDKWKLGLYRDFFMEKKRKQIKKEISSIRNKLDNFLTLKHCFDYLTLDGYANMVKTQFITAMSICDINKKPCFMPSDFFDINYSLIDKALRHINEHRLSHETLRELARTEPWRSIFAARKEDVFGISPADMSEDQRIILLYSRMYESISNHPETPPDEIIEDDDALDGWMIENRKNAEREKHKRDVESKLGGKHKDATEVYLPASSKEEVKRIEDLNDVQAKMTKVQREAVLKKQGKVKEANLPDVKQELQMQQQQAILGAAKRR